MDRKILCIYIGHINGLTTVIEEYYVFEGIRNRKYSLEKSPGKISMGKLYKQWSLFRGFATIEAAIEKMAERIKLHNEGKADIDATIPNNKRKYRERKKTSKHGFINPRIRQSGTMRRIQQRRFAGNAGSDVGKT